MKKTITLFGLLLFIFQQINSQNLLDSSNTEPMSPGSLFDIVYDKDGNSYNLANLAIKFNSGVINVSPAYTCQAGFFNIYFASGSGMGGNTQTDINRRATVCQVFQNLAGLLNGQNWSSTVAVNILVDDISSHVTNASSNSILGLATSFYAFPSNPANSNPGIIQNQVQKTIRSKRDAWTNVVTPLNLASSSGFYHGFLAINFANTSFNWNSTHTVTAASNQVDLYSVCLHEATHLLGFASLIGGNGQSIYTGSNNYYSTYDKFLRDYQNNPLIVSNSTCSAQYNIAFATSTANLSPGCTSLISDVTNCSNACNYNSSLVPNMPVYTPNCYESGSSLSHFEDMCYPTNNSLNNNQYFTMSNVIPTGINKRFLKPEERRVLCDQGYNVITTYTSQAAGAYTTYAGSSCVPPNVWGVNDGIANSVFSFTSTGGSITIPITNVVNNDAPSVSIKCVESVYNNGTVTVVGANIIFTPVANYTGLVLIRYVPYIGSDEGNITYIFAFIYAGTCSPVSPCDLVQNGGFESNNGCAAFVGTVTASCWTPYTLTPDLFVRNCFNSIIPANLGSNTYNSTIANSPSPFNSHAPITGNNAVMGVGAVINGLSITTSESFANFLGAPLVNNQTYVLRFWAYQFVGSKLDPVGSPSVAQAFNTASVPVVLSFATSNLYNPTTQSSFPNPVSNIPLVSTTLSSNFNVWKSYTVAFTYTNSTNGNMLYIGTDDIKTYLNYAYQVGSGSVNNYLFYTLIDDVSIKPLSSSVSFNLPATALCSAQGFTDLAQYVNIPGGVFSGPGVTSSGNLYNFNTPASLGNGVYTIVYTYTDNIGCVQNVFQQVTIGNINNGVVVSSASPQNCIAGSTLTVISPTTGLTYTWQPGGIVSNPVTLSPNVNTTYSAMAILSSSCSYMGTVLVMPAIPTATLYGNGSSACWGTTITALGTFTSIVWQPGNYTANPVIVTPSVSNFYTATITNSIGCTNTLSIFIQAVTPNYITLVPSSPTICGGAQTTITASSNLPISGYTWSPGNYTTNPVVVSPTINTIYTLNVSNSLGCLGNQTVALGVTGFSITASSGTICTGSVLSLTAGGNYTSIIWQPGSFTGSTYTTVLMGSQVFTAIATFSNGCVVTQTYQVNTVDVPVNYNIITNYPVTCTGNTETLTLSGTPAITTLTWLPGNTTTNPAIITPTATTSYTALVTSSLGCIFPIVQTVTVSNNCCTGSGQALANLAPVTQTITGSKLINANIIVPSNLKYTLSGEFKFGSNIKIIVSQNATLSIEGSHLYACSTNMWQGIDVMSGGQVVCKTGSTDNLVEDAITAINVSNNNSQNSTLDISNTTFNKNYISVSISNYGQNISTYPYSIKRCVFTCRNLPYTANAWPQTGTVSAVNTTGADLRFASSSPTALASPYLNQNGFTVSNLKNPLSSQSSQTAIFLNGVGLSSNNSGIVIGDGALANNFNLFDSHYKGIDALNCNLNSYNNVFQNALPGGNGTAYGIRTENNYNLALLFNTKLDLVSPTNPTLNINRFYNCPYGIEAVKQATVNIRYASITSTQNINVAPNAQLGGYTGISIISNRFDNYIINSCRFLNLYTGIYGQSVAGFLPGGTYGQTWGSFSITTNFFCPATSTSAAVGNGYVGYSIRLFNTLNNSKTGASANFFNFSPNNGLRVMYNTCYKVQRGIEVQGYNDLTFNRTVANNDMLIVPNPNTAVTQFGIRSSLNKITVVNSNSVIGSSIPSTQNVAGIYVVDNTSDAVQCNYVTTLPRGFEFANPNPGTQWRSNAMNSCGRGLMATSWGLSSGGGIGPQGATNAPSGNAWTGSSLNNLQLWVDASSSAVFSKVYVSSTGAGSVNPLYCAFGSGGIQNNSYIPLLNRPLSSGGVINCTPTGGGSGGSGGGIGGRQAIAIAIDTIGDENGEINKLLLFIELNMDSLLLYSNDTLVDFYNNSKDEEMGQLYDIESALAAGAFDQADGLIQGFDPQTNIQQNFKRFFQLYYNYGTGGSLSVDDSSDLFVLSNQCPYTDGPAVHKARSLYSLIYRAAVEYNDDSCQTRGYSGRIPHFSTQNEPDKLSGLLAANESKNVKRKIRNSLSVYPNPTTDWFYIRGGKDNEQINVVITEINGRIVFADKVIINGSRQMIKPNLINGIYFVNLINGIGVKTVKKLIIAK